MFPNAARSNAKGGIDIWSDKKRSYVDEGNAVEAFEGDSISN
jgi:hypothetical protein